jgi:catechol 2,3-dioxygenase-like lactoylglutathione lyase family enzyme
MFIVANTRIATDVKLVGVRRGVNDPKRSADFYAWLLGMDPEATGEGFRFACANGEFRIHQDASTPIAIEWQTGMAQFRGNDLDGVPVGVSSHDVEPASSAVALDHVSLNCANLAEAIAFYRRLGLVVTWSGVPPDYSTSRTGFQEEPLEGADWVHLSGADGYLALSQADWLDFGIHNANAGPPRLVHVGFSVANLAAVAARVEAAGIRTFRAPANSLGDRLYLNDPDGDPLLGSNVELVEYKPGVPRSGKPPY